MMIKIKYGFKRETEGHQEMVVEMRREEIFKNFQIIWLGRDINVYAIQNMNSGLVTSWDNSEDFHFGHWVQIEASCRQAI